LLLSDDSHCLLLSNDDSHCYLLSDDSHPELMKSVQKVLAWLSLSVGSSLLFGCTENPVKTAHVHKDCLLMSGQSLGIFGITVSHILRPILGLFLKNVCTWTVQRARTTENEQCSLLNTLKELVHSVRTMADISVTFCEHPSVFSG
jgi:hypothetical protein